MDSSKPSAPGRGQPAAPGTAPARAPPAPGVRRPYQLTPYVGWIPSSVRRVWAGAPASALRSRSRSPRRGGEGAGEEQKAGPRKQVPAGRPQHGAEVAARCRRGRDGRAGRPRGEIRCSDAPARLSAPTRSGGAQLLLHLGDARLRATRLLSPPRRRAPLTWQLSRAPAARPSPSPLLSPPLRAPDPPRLPAQRPPLLSATPSPTGAHWQEVGASSTDTLQKPCHWPEVTDVRSGF